MLRKEEIVLEVVLQELGAIFPSVLVRVVREFLECCDDCVWTKDSGDLLFRNPKDNRTQCFSCALECLLEGKLCLVCNSKESQFFLLNSHLGFVKGIPLCSLHSLSEWKCAKDMCEMENCARVAVCSIEPSMLFDDEDYYWDYWCHMHCPHDRNVALESYQAPDWLDASCMEWRAKMFAC